MYASGTATGPGATDALFQAIRTQLLANGWVILDTISDTSGSRNIVFQGTAIDATAGNKPIVQITATTTTQLTFAGYYDWDSTAHAGMGQCGSTSATILHTQDASFNYWMRTNPYSLAIATKIGAAYYKNYVGFMRRGLAATKSGVTKTTQAYAAGVTSMVVASDMTSSLKAGQYVHIVNYAHSNTSANKTNHERIQISSITSTTITFQTSTTKAYDSGALIGYNPMPIICCTDTSGTLPCAGFYVPMTLDGAAFTATPGFSLGGIGSVIESSVSSTSPEAGSGEYVGGYWVIYSAVTATAGIYGTLYSWETVYAINQLNEDIMDDGTYQFQMFNVSANTPCSMLGPTNS